MDHASNTPATLPAQLMAKPAITFEEFFQTILGLPDSTAEELVRSNTAPKFFLLGRRRYIRTEDAKVWIDQMAATTPYFPRRNRRAAA
jgi:hypothetical protein